MGVGGVLRGQVPLGGEGKVLGLGLRLSDAPALVHDALGEGGLGLLPLHHEHRPAVAGGQPALDHQLPHGGGQGGEPQGVGDGGAGLAHPGGQLLLGQPEVGEQGQVALRLLHRVEVFPLEVFDQAQLQHLPVVRLDDDHRHLPAAGQLGGPPAALPGDDLIVPGGQPPDCEGLDNAVFPDGGGQIGQGVFIEPLSGLVQPGLYLGDGQGYRSGLLVLHGGGVAHQGVQALSQTLGHSHLLHSFLFVYDRGFFCKNSLASAS